MIPPIHREPDRDSRLGAQLGALELPADAARDEALVARIVQAARPRLAELRRGPRPWWEWTAAWARIAIPAGVAASLVAGAIAIRETDEWLAAAPVPPAGQAAVALDTVAERALMLGFADEEGSELAGTLIAQATDDWIAAEVLDR